MDKKWIILVYDKKGNFIDLLPNNGYFDNFTEACEYLYDSDYTSIPGTKLLIWTKWKHSTAYIRGINKVLE